MAESYLRINESAEQFYRRCTNLSYFDCSEEEMLWWMMGPRRLPLQEIIPISVVLLVIFLTGVAGNVAVCVVIVRHPAMHTATNYYLFSLALSDLLLLLFGLPNDLSVYWHQYPYSLGIVFCKLRALISEAWWSIMWKLRLCVAFVVAVIFDGVAGRSFVDSQSKDNVRVIGGTEVDIKQYPYQVSVLVFGLHYCGGSIISEKYVLTAAHCIGYLTMDYYLIRAGSTYRKGGELYEVESIVTHPKFSFEDLDYDIAVIKIYGEFKINGKTIDIVELAEESSELFPQDLVTVTGWGDTTGLGNYSEVLLAATLPVISKKRCIKAWRKHQVTITDRMMCAGFKKPKRSACYGDSGSPVVDDNLVQHGIVSFGSNGCLQHGKPNVFTSVASLRSWILKHAGV